jgi:threonine synthase
MHKDLYAVSITDDVTRQTIKEAYSQYGVLLEPHGAVAWAGLVRYLNECGDWSPCISLETADPAKFPEEIVRLTGINPALPQVMARLDELEEHFEKMNGNYASLRNYLGRFLTVV